MGIKIKHKLIKPSLTDVSLRLHSPPISVLEQWVQKRIVPSGEPYTAMMKFVIKEASVKEHPLTIDNSLKGIFTEQQSHQYDFILDGELMIFAANGQHSGVASARVTRTITMLETLTISERNQQITLTLDRALNDFDRELVKNISNNFLKWLF